MNVKNILVEVEKDNQLSHIKFKVLALVSRLENFDTTLLGCFILILYGRILTAIVFWNRRLLNMRLLNMRLNYRFSDNLALSDLWLSILKNSFLSLRILDRSQYVLWFEHSLWKIFIHLLLLFVVFNMGESRSSKVGAIIVIADICSRRWNLYLTKNIIEIDSWLVYSEGSLNFVRSDEFAVFVYDLITHLMIKIYSLIKLNQKQILYILLLVHLNLI